MTPLRLTARNYASFPTLDFTFADGVVAIVGPNGVGKSTLLNGVELALFADGARDLAPALGPFDEKLEIALEFKHNGNCFRIRRSYSSGGRGRTTLDFERLVFSGADGPSDSPGGWKTENREKTSETQAAIETTLGLNRATFNASAFLAQGNSAAFTDATPAERKAILGGILDAAEIWPRLANRALADRRITETEIEIAQRRIAEREPLAAQVPELHRAADIAGVAQEQARENHRQAEERLEAAQKAEADNQAAAERLKTAEKARMAVLEARDRTQRYLKSAQEAQESLDAVRTVLAALDQQVAEIPELERKAEEQRTAALRIEATGRLIANAQDAIAAQRIHLERASSAFEQARRDEAAASARYQHLKGSEPGAERCDRCEQILGEQARAAALASLRREAEELLQTLFEKEQAYDAAQRERAKLAAALAEIPVPEPYAPERDYSHALESARQAAQERAGLGARLDTYKAIAAGIHEHRTALTIAETTLMAANQTLEAAQEATADPEALAEKTGRARRDLANRRVDLEEAAADLARAQAAVAAARVATDELREAQAKAADLITRLATLRLAERALGRDGVPALIAENACASIEAEANRVLERLPTEAGTVFRLELRTQRALKSSDALKETLDILVSDRQTTREFATFSGGECFRVSFALRWALARLLAGRRGAESRLLVIDEPDGLDAAGMDGLAALLHEEADIFSRVLIVSHNPLLASAFERVVTVTSDGEVSRSESAA